MSFGISIRRVHNSPFLGPAILAALLTLFIWQVFLRIPIEREQGIVQKIFFIHVPSAILMEVGYFIGFMFSIIYLIQKKSHQFITALAAIEVAFFLNTAVLLTGPLWARPIWHAWWVWDPRLTSTLILWLTYMAYLYIGSGITADRQPKMGASIIAVVAFVNIPIVHYSIDLWRGVHPSVLSNPGGLPDSMRYGLRLGLLLVVCLYGLLFHIRRRSLIIQERLATAEMKFRMLTIEKESTL